MKKENKSVKKFNQQVIPIQHVPLSLCDKPDFHFINYTEDQISRRAADINPLCPPIIKVVDSYGRFLILDGVLNKLAMEAKGMKLCLVQIHDCDPADYAFESIKLNKRKKLTHRMIAHMIPIIIERWERNNSKKEEKNGN